MTTTLPRLRNPLDYMRPRVVRIGVTGLARAGKTVLLTTIASLLLSPGALGGRLRSVRPAPLGAGNLPRFDGARHLASLAADPPRWPERTNSLSLLALDLELGDPMLPPRRVRLELLDYPGEWLLDLALLDQEFAPWSAAVLRRLEQPSLLPLTRDFLAFVRGLPASAAADEALAESGHRLYRATLARLRDERHLSTLQPGRFLMPAPGGSPPWEQFFPCPGTGGLVSLLGSRFAAYKQSVRDGLQSPMFGALDRLAILADLLGALHTGAEAYADAGLALSTVAASLHWRSSWLETASTLLRLHLPLPTIRRVAFVATKSDHVAERQRGNLAALMRSTARLPDDAPQARAFAIAAARCTEDFVWTLDGRPVSAVRGRVLGEKTLTRSYPGEVPDQPPDASFWQHPFLELPRFEPARLPTGGSHIVPNLGVEALLAFLLEDLL